MFFWEILPPVNAIYEKFGEHKALSELRARFIVFFLKRARNFFAWWRNWVHIIINMKLVTCGSGDGWTHGRISVYKGDFGWQDSLRLFRTTTILARAHFVYPLQVATIPCTCDRFVFHKNRMLTMVPDLLWIWRVCSLALIAFSTIAWLSFFVVGSFVDHDGASNLVSVKYCEYVARLWNRVMCSSACLSLHQNVAALGCIENIGKAFHAESTEWPLFISLRNDWSSLWLDSTAPKFIVTRRICVHVLLPIKF